MDGIDIIERDDMPEGTILIGGIPIEQWRQAMNDLTQEELGRFFATINIGVQHTTTDNGDGTFTHTFTPENGGR